MNRRCPDCDVYMEDVKLRTYDANPLAVTTDEPREGILGKLGIHERLDVKALMCPRCGLVRTYADLGDLD